MGRMVIAVYRPKVGREVEFLELLRQHLPLLREYGLVTTRPALIMSAGDRSVLEIFEWGSEEAPHHAHQNSLIQSHWRRMSEEADFVPLSEVPECQKPFAEFEPLILPS